ncbi:MAG TPA: hypothetical protein VF590_24325 [Isosphaeraceae bacterium]|jgi:hypothetical protein
MTMHDEVALRRPDFLSGSPIALADGQQWTFPAPPPRLVPGTAAGFGADYTATVAAIREAEDEVERLRAELALAICLLERNYDLGPAALFDLLGYPPGTPALTAAQKELHRLALEHVRQAGGPADTRTPRGVTGSVIPAPKAATHRRRGLSGLLHPTWGRA